MSKKQKRRTSKKHKRRILIVTQDIDPHADVMVLHLEKRGIRPIRFHPQDIGGGDGVTIRFDGKDGESWRLETPGGGLDGDEVGSVWYRRPMYNADPDLLPEDGEFARREIRAAVMGLFRITDAFWVNAPDAVRIAESKPLQLQVARQLGFEIPPTLITNRPEELRRFHDEMKGDVVCKVMTQGILGSTDAKGVYTARVEPGDLDAGAALTRSPCLFQRRIEKTLDIRVTVIGRKVFATEIHSQEDRVSRLDWRRGAVEDMRHEPHRLPRRERKRCRALLKRFGLSYGAIDLVVTPEGGYVFLEINPSGQFVWIESMTGQPLVETLADLLVAHT